MVRRRLRPVRADRRIAPVTVEIQAVVARMIENAVQDHADIPFAAGAKERPKSFFSPEHLIDRAVIARVVFVIGVSVEDRT